MEPTHTTRYFRLDCLSKLEWDKDTHFKHPKNAERRDFLNNSYQQQVTTMLPIAAVQGVSEVKICTSSC